MEPKNNHIDQLLQSQLGNASVNAENIDWDSFNKHKRKKAFLFYRMLSLGLLGLILIIGTIFTIYYNNEEKISGNKVSESSQSIKEFKDKEFDFNNKISENKQELSTNKNSEIPPSSEPLNKNYSPNIEEIKKSLKTGETPKSISNSPSKGIMPVKNSEILFLTINFKPVLNLFKYIKPTYNAEKIYNYIEKPVTEYNIPVKPGTFVEIQAGPGFNKPDFKVTESGRSFIHKDYQNIRRLAETAQLGYNLNIGVLRTFGPFKYGVGIGFSKIEFNGNYDFKYSEKPVLDTEGKIFEYIGSNSQNIQYKSKHKLSFIEIPINIQYTVFDAGKISLGIKLGYVSQFLNNLSGELPNPVFLDRKESLSSENYKTRTSSVQTSLLIEYKLKNNRSVLLVPEFRRGLGFKQVQSHFKTDFNYWGLNLNYRFAL